MEILNTNSDLGTKNGALKRLKVRWVMHIFDNTKKFFYRPTAAKSCKHTVRTIGHGLWPKPFKLDRVFVHIFFKRTVDNALYSTYNICNILLTSFQTLDELLLGLHENNKLLEGLVNTNNVHSTFICTQYANKQHSVSG